MNQACRVGVTGHRWNGLRKADAAQLRRQVRVVLESIPRHLGPLGTIQTPQLLSPLAEGSDRIAASIALDLGYALHCVLPFARAIYEQDFETPASREEFRSLLARAVEVVELPTRPSSPDQRVAGYAAAGRWVTAESHLLLAIWDGRPERGEGGTGQMVREALEHSHPVIWVHAEAPHDVCLPTRDGTREGLSVLPERLAEIFRFSPSRG